MNAHTHTHTHTQTNTNKQTHAPPLAATHRRVVFASMRKWDGECLRELAPAEVKLIAGRAGRYGGPHCGGCLFLGAGEGRGNRACEVASCLHA